MRMEACGRGFNSQAGAATPATRSTGQDRFFERVVRHTSFRCKRPGNVCTLQIGFDGYPGGWRGIAFGARQIQGKSPMTPLFQFADQGFPTPGAMGSAMNQQEIHAANIANVLLVSNVLAAERRWKVAGDSVPGFRGE
jgi:hypothetical protein